MEPFRLDIITPTRSAFSEEVERVSVPTPNGQIEVLAHHIALFTSLAEGEVKISNGKKEYFLSIGGGFMEVTGGQVNILVSRAAHADEINESDIKKAQASAKELLTKYKSGVERANAMAVLKRSTLDLKVLRRRKHGSLTG